MDCNKFKNHFLDYYYGECDPLLGNEIRAHLSGCNDCNALYRKISAVLGSAGNLKDTGPDSFYYTRLASRLEEKKLRFRNARIVTWLAQPLVAACLALLGIFIGTRMSSGLSGNRQEINNKQAEVTVLQVADEYYLSQDETEQIENYYLTK